MRPLRYRILCFAMANLSTAMQEVRKAICHAHRVGLNDTADRLCRAESELRQAWNEIEQESEKEERP